MVTAAIKLCPLREVPMPRVVRAFPLRSSHSELEAFAAQMKAQRAPDAARFFSTLWRQVGVVASSGDAEWPLGDRR
jgi:hypothetical protein